MIETISYKYAKANKIVAIEIPNDLKSKLFEMCNNIFDNKNPNATIFLQDKVIKIPKQGPKEFGYHEIHWFELCTTHLCFHIMSDPLQFLSYCIDYSMTEDKTFLDHPIQVLYNEYDKIRDLFKNKYNSKGNTSIIRYGI